jgi:antiviral helicase SKI2
LSGSKRFVLHVILKINSVNELVLTELVLENALAAYEPEEVVALLSSFVFQEKTEVQPIFPPRLEEGREALVAISDRVAEVQARHSVAADEHRWTLNFGLMEAVYEWAKGMVGICHCLWLNDC